MRSARPQRDGRRRLSDDRPQEYHSGARPLGHGADRVAVLLRPAADGEAAPTATTAAATTAATTAAGPAAAGPADGPAGHAPGRTAGAGPGADAARAADARGGDRRLAARSDRHAAAEGLDRAQRRAHRRSLARAIPRHRRSQ